MGAVNNESESINQLIKVTLLRLAAALGQGSSSERAELCNSLHTCHRKCLKEPPENRFNKVLLGSRSFK